MMVSDVGLMARGSSSSLPPRAYHGQLGGEALHVLGLALEEAHGDEHGEVEVLVAGGLEHGVHVLLDVLPQRVAVRLDDHGAANRALVHHVGAIDDVVVPAAEVLGVSG